MSDNIPISSDSIGIANIATQNEIGSGSATDLNGSYCRVMNHLMKVKGGGIASCSRVINANLSEMQKLVEEAELRVKQSLPRHVALPNTSLQDTTIGSSNSSNYSNLLSHDLKKRNGGPLEKAFNIGAREKLDGEIARMFYMDGLSFHFARNPYYVRAFTNALPGHVPLSYNALRTTLLQKEKSNIEQLLVPIKSTWKTNGTDVQRIPLINIMAVCDSGPMFLKTINCERDQKDKYFISNLLVDSIQEIGPENVVHVITDNAPVCKAARLLVESKFPHIFWTPCVVHTLNLALNSICSPSPHPRYDDIMEECGWIAKVCNDVFFIKHFIMNHSMRLAMFNAHSKLKMLSVADTRFASTIVMLKRFKQIKQGLKQMVISERWDVYKDDDL
ncbi:hypothetical protein EZV62_022846 [Acer yangbiense]|uniref:DUF659 domain-containing protein n=1 Tax=Acer yangbiense TaxID=1000413 RepID=A0A5C7H1G0_9ROSI|nr:hypothetical protein EZV62_022846 [Acer yangbiense]